MFHDYAQTRYRRDVSRCEQPLKSCGRDVKFHAGLFVEQYMSRVGGHNLVARMDILTQQPEINGEEMPPPGVVT